jgi:curved DNA-binding protein CbpA
VNKGDPDAEKKFQEIQRAYEVDDEKRSLYDRVKFSVRLEQLLEYSLLYITSSIVWLVKDY